MAGFSLRRWWAAVAGATFLVTAAAGGALGSDGGMAGGGAPASGNASPKMPTGESLPWDLSPAAQETLTPKCGECPDFGCNGCGNSGCIRPASQGCYELTASLLFLQPGSGNLEYATLVSPLPVPTPNWANRSLSPDMNAAFEVGLRFFNECGNDLEVDWTHLDTSTRDSVFADPVQFVGPSYEIGPDASSFRIARGEVDFRYDAVNLDAGHNVNLGGGVEVRVFGGVQYARVRENLSASFASEDGLTANGNTTDSLFNGVGPRVGMKAQAASGNFEFLGEIAGSALIGSMESRIDFSAISPSLAGLGITPPNVQSLTSPNATQVVPVLDTKLGSSYTVPTCHYGIFKIEGGYRAAVYVNAVNEYSLSEVVTPPTAQSVGVFLRTAEHQQSDFTVHGPYLSASWTF
jgi:hypothetical protein